MTQPLKLKKEQKKSYLQMVICITFLALYYLVGYHFFNLVMTDSGADRLLLAARWSSLIVLVLLFAIINVGLKRFNGTPEEFSGGNTERLHFSKAFLSNTMEQGFASVLILFGLAATLPGASLQLIPLTAILYLIGRILFFIGYKTNPVWRTLGFGMTILPNLVACVYIVISLF